jgi:hypothetical protein
MHMNDPPSRKYTQRLILQPRLHPVASSPR